MRQIKKTHPLPSLQKWVRENRDLPNFNYKNGLPKLIKDEVRDQLMSEQYYLCAYSGVQIALGECHIEHLKPQNKCENGEDLDY